MFESVWEAPQIAGQQQMRQITAVKQQSSKNMTSQLEQAMMGFLEKVHQKASVQTPQLASPVSSMGVAVSGSGGGSLHDTIHSTYQDNLLFLYDDLNCSNIDFVMHERYKFSSLIEILNVISYVIIIIGIAFNILNLIVLLKSKLNESPYTYLTMLAFSDLGAISMVGIEKIRQLIEEQTDWNVSPALASFTGYAHLYVAAGINIFLSSSMYITLALTIERFIFVHSPFKVY